MIYMILHFECFWYDSYVFNMSSTENEIMRIVTFYFLLPGTFDFFTLLLLTVNQATSYPYLMPVQSRIN